MLWRGVCQHRHAFCIHARATGLCLAVCVSHLCRHGLARHRTRSQPIDGKINLWSSGTEMINLCRQMRMWQARQSQPKLSKPSQSPQIVAQRVTTHIAIRMTEPWCDRIPRRVNMSQPLLAARAPGRSAPQSSICCYYQMCALAEHIPDTGPAELVQRCISPISPPPAHCPRQLGLFCYERR